MATMEAIHAVVSGRVQGVGFRYSTEAMGRRLGLTGWVRNQTDGTVETWAQGPPEVVDAFISYLKEGPLHASVTSVDLSRVEPDPALTTFRIRF